MPDMEPTADEWLTRREAAEYTKTTPGTLATFAAAKRGPKMYKPSTRKVLYRKSDLDAWITSREATKCSRGTTTPRDHHGASCRDVHEPLTGWEHMHPHDLRGHRVIVRTPSGTVVDGELEVADVTPHCQITSLNIRDTNIYVIRCWRNKDDSWDNELDAKMSVTILKEKP